MLRQLIIPVLTAGLAVATVVGAENLEPPKRTPKRTPKLSELFGDETIAQGKGVEVKRSHLDEAFVAYQSSLAARSQQIREDRRVAEEAQILQRLIVTQILTNRVNDADRKEAKGIAERFVQEARQKAVSEEAFHRQMKAMGLSVEQFQLRITEQSLAEAVIQRELTSKIVVSEAQIKDFYDTGTDLLVKLMSADLEKMVKDPAVTPALLAQLKQRTDDLRKANLARLEQPERVRISHVFFTTLDRRTEEPLPDELKKRKRQEMEKIRKKALDGEDFAKLVEQFSEDRSVKQTKGEYTLSRVDNYAPEFVAAAFSLAPGKVSDVVATANGLHVIKLLEKIPGRKVEFEKVSGDLKEFLSQQEVQRAMPEYFSRLAKEAGVEILDPKYRSVLNLGAEPKKALLEPAPGSNVKSAFVPVEKKP